MKKTLYLPSFSVGSLATEAKRNTRFRDEFSFKFWADDFIPGYQYPYFLLTAGHSYKDMECRKKYGLEKSFVFGDSGGFQICTGALPYSTEDERTNIRSKIFNWLEANSDVACNLDIPTRGKFSYNDALKFSLENFEYFDKHKSGSTKYLNVLHGKTVDQYNDWYSNVKNFNFSGWAIGGALTLYGQLSSLCCLLMNKEHLKNNVEYIHYLGISGIMDFIVMSQIQKSLNEVGSNAQIMFDSSSPNMSSKFGKYFTNWNLKTMGFNGVKITRERELGIYDGVTSYGFPEIVEIDKYFNKHLAWEEIVKYDNQIYAILTIHNLFVFLQAKQQIDYYVNHADVKEMREMVFNADCNTILTIVDKMIKDDNPYLVFKKYEKYLLDMTTKYPFSEVIDDSEKTGFFNFE